MDVADHAGHVVDDEGELTFAFVPDAFHGVFLGFEILTHGGEGGDDGFDSVAKFVSGEVVVEKLLFFLSADLLPFGEGDF